MAHATGRFPLLKQTERRPIPSIFALNYFLAFSLGIVATKNESAGCLNRAFFFKF